MYLEICIQKKWLRVSSNCVLGVAIVNASLNTKNYLSNVCDNRIPHQPGIIPIELSRAQ
jgi:hypothetical protein